jgi:hypothetical protein
LTYEERYNLGHAEGFRIGMIEVSREFLLRCVKKRGMEQKTAASKLLIQKINRETDYRFLEKMLKLTICGDITIADLEIYYDMVFLTKEGLLKNEND